MGSNPKPLLVTGAAGFIGWRFAESCALKGIPVIAVDKKEHFGARPEHEPATFGDVIDRDSLERELPRLARGVRGIVHVGACSSTMQTDVAYLKKVNVEYSKMLWRFCAEHHLPFIYASSAATYGAGELGYDDDESKLTKLKPLNAYGQSKQDFDVWALSEDKNGRKPPAWSGFKFFNVYGYGERHKTRQMSVVVSAYDQIRSTGKIRLFKSHKDGIGDGEQKRDFILVDDVIAGLHFALEKPISRGIYNLGTGQARSFLDLARAVFAALGKPEQIEFIDTPVEIRDRYQYFTEAKMERLRAQGFQRPFTPLEDGVRRTVKRLEAATAPAFRA